MKTRLIVMTDISSLEAKQGEPDDTQSFVRLLLYANEFDIEGLIATFTGHKGGVHPEYLEAVIREYAKVRDNLALHDSHFPEPDRLLSVVKPGRSEDETMGAGKDTAGSDWIILVVDRPDPRPVWIVIWGGPRELAQALWKIERERGKEKLAEFTSKIRVYAINDQDETGPWIRKNHPGLFYITAKLSFRGLYRGGDTSLASPEWVYANICNGHGPLGAAYPNYDGGDPWGRVRGIKEGDTPSFLYLIQTGLSDPMQPTWGCWGGRFVGPGLHYTDAKDTVGDDTSPQATVYRWRREFQADFAARMDWCTKLPKETNHPPKVRIKGETQRSVKPGQRVELKASASDPDGDSLSYRWWLYTDASSSSHSASHDDSEQSEESAFPSSIKIENANTPSASFTAPRATSATTLHIILSVTDSGNPPLTRYARVIVQVSPA